MHEHRSPRRPMQASVVCPLGAGEDCIGAVARTGVKIEDVTCFSSTVSTIKANAGVT